MDWSVPIGVLVVEMDGTNYTKDRMVRSLLHAHGMLLVKQHMGFRHSNDLWVGPTLAKQASAASREAAQEARARDCSQRVDVLPRPHPNNTCSQFGHFGGGASLCEAHRVGKSICRHESGTDSCKRDLRPEALCWLDAATDIFAAQHARTSAEA